MSSSVKNRLFAKFAGLADSAAGKLSFEERDVSFFVFSTFVNPDSVINYFIFYLSDHPDCK